MKKTGILLLASAALLLSSCGAKYELYGDDDAVLSMLGSSYTIQYDLDDVVVIEKGKAEKEEKEGTYTLTPTSYTCKVEDPKELDKLEELAVAVALAYYGFDEDEIEEALDGKKVTVKDEYKGYGITIDKEEKEYRLGK